MSRTSWEHEHVDEPPDHADAYALLDESQIRAEYCPDCARWICTCDEEAPEKYRSYGSGSRRFHQDRDYR